MSSKPLLTADGADYVLGQSQANELIIGSLVVEIITLTCNKHV